MARTATALLTAALLAGAIASARGDTTPAPAAPPPAITTTTPTTTAPPPPTATTTAPPPSPTTAPAVGTASAVSAVSRARPHRRVPARPRPVAHAAAAGSVTIRDFSFGPSAITVNAGETVTWINDGPTAHTATGGGFDTGTLKQGQSASHTFASAGTFSYHCTLHPFMKGTVTVVAAAASTGSSSAAPAPARAVASPGSALPRTGGHPLPVAALGALLVLLGCGLRRLRVD